MILPVFVSLTTISSRRSELERVISSLLNQSLKPAKVILNISREPYLLDEGISFETLPKSVRHLAVAGRIELYFTKNNGPYRKLLPTLTRYAGSEYFVVTADDDVVYPINWLSGLYNAAYRQNCVAAYRCREMRTNDGQLVPYSSWPIYEAEAGEAPGSRRPTPSFALCPTGRGGIIYHSTMLKNLNLLDDLRALAPAQDDLAFKFATLLNGTKVIPLHYTVSGSKTPEFTDAVSDNTSLFHSHNNAGRNDQAISDITKYCKEKYGVEIAKYV